MNEAILSKTRKGTLVAGLVAVVISGPAVSWNFALGLGLTVLWAVAGFFVLEKLLRTMVVAPGQGRNVFTGMAWLAAKLVLYGLALWGLLQQRFPAFSHVLGLTLLLIVLMVVGIIRGQQDTIQSTRQGDDGD